MIGVVVRQKGLSMFSSTAQGYKSTALASGWGKSMVLNPVESGANCIWRWMPTAATSSLTS